MDVAKKKEVTWKRSYVIWIWLQEFVQWFINKIEDRLSTFGHTAYFCVIYYM